MDMSLGRFHSHRIRLPRDTPLEYKEHIKAPTRVYEKDKDGNPTGRYVKGDTAADHYAHARTYNEVALKLAASALSSQNIEDEV
jgi:hypothetical protein